jgi:hypothetical protein
MKHCKPQLGTPMVVKITRKRQEMKNIMFGYQVLFNDEVHLF